MEMLLIEPVHIQDIFASAIARVDRLPGDCVRLVFYVEDKDETGRPIRVVVAKLVRPITGLLAHGMILGRIHPEMHEPNIQH